MSESTGDRTTETIASRMYACHERDGWQAAAALLFEGAQEIERLKHELHEFKRMIGPAEDIERENERLRAALESTRHKTPTAYNHWLDSVLKTE